jgi:CelD/BcsL family acetyltransferase involved in cellulose biosynthesis/glycosyltransferase involved in cell wall biosynthesis
MSGEPAAEVAGAMVLVWGPPSHGPRSRALARELGVPIHFVHVTDRRGGLAAPYKYAAQTLRTFALLRRERPGTVLVQSPPSLAVLAVYLWSLLSGVRFVVDAHSDAMDNPYWTRPAWLHRHLARRAVATVVTNEHYAERIRGWGAGALVLRDVPTSFDVGAPWPTDGAFRVAVVNTFAADEPLDAILDAAAALPDVHFEVTGALKRAPSDLGGRTPSNVTFTDFLPDERYYSLLASSDAVMCLTTRDNTMQRGACEALSLGRPIITSRWPLLEDYFRAGTVHVDADAASIRDGVRAMRDHIDDHERGIARLRIEQHEEWRLASCSLRAMLDGHGANAAVAGTATTSEARAGSGQSTSGERPRRRRSEASAARRALRHAPAVFPSHRARSVQVLETPRDLETLRTEWDGLRADFRGPANSFVWCLALAHAPPPDRRLCILALRDGGQLIAVAPLTRSLGHDGTLRLITEYDASGFLYADDRALGWLIDAVLGLRRPLVLTSLLAGSATEQLLRRRLRRGLWLRWVHVWTMGPEVRIDETFADPRATLVNNRRSASTPAATSGSASPVSSRWFRRRLRKAEELGQVTFHVDPIGDDVEERFAELVRIEDSGWKGRGRSSLAQDASQRETLRRFICAPEMRDHVRFGSLRIDGEPIAVDLVVVVDDRLWTLKDGFDERYGRLSPGMLLLLHVLSWAVAQGLRHAEFMGRMEDWKNEWGDGRTLHHLRVYPRTPRGVFALGTDIASGTKVQRTLRARLGARRATRTGG